MTNKTTSKTFPRRRFGLALLAGLLLLLLWLGLKTWRVAQAAQSLLAQQAAAEALIAGGPSAVDPDAAERLVSDVRRDVMIIKRETAVFMPLTPYLGWLPRVGPLVTEAPVLLEMADAGTAAAAYGMRGLKPALHVLQDETQTGTDQIAALIPILDTAAPDLQQASLELDRFIDARSRLQDPESLPWTVRNLLQRADPWLPIAREGVQAASILPEMMGINGPRSYLLIAQNEDEARPTGGFITGVGELTVANGRIVNLNFVDANYVDAWDEERRSLTKPYADPPQPLQTFMLLDLFLFRDANFWPDFPVSAEMMLDLYSYGQDRPPPHGVIAIDQRFLQMLMQAIGPVTITEEDVTINGSNVISAMRDAWSYDENAEQEVREWLFDRKSFMSTFANAILNKIQSDFGSIDPIRLVQTMMDAIDQRHLQIYLRDPAAAAVLDDVGWDGRFQNESGQDVLGIVDTNVGYSKVNPLIDRRLTYRVDLNNRQAELLLTYRHNGPPPGSETCYQGTPYTGGISYEERINTCYWNYLRIYTPQGSQLLAATQHEIPGETMFNGQDWREPAAAVAEPVPLTPFANAFLLPWSETLTTQFTYTLPPAVVRTADGRQQYRLTVLKQAGTSAQPLQVEIALPPGASVIATQPEAAVNGTAVVFTTELNTNLDLQVTFQVE